jgi:hypothetical protein
MKLLLNNRQFSHGNKCVLKEKKVEMRKFIRELEKNKIVELFASIYDKNDWKRESTYPSKKKTKRNFF